jgi:Domain of unknown function (DUF6434)/SAP domain-containing new25
MKRPDIKKIKTGEELKRWYWLKKELEAFCKLKKLSYAGTKFDILERLANAIDKGVSGFKILIHKPASKFVWSKSTLTLNTIITDSYTNGPNTRKFFKEHCGGKFHFSIPFMNFMKNNCGKTLGDAVNEWERLHELSKQKNFKSDIPVGNQYNQYIRDFFTDNPNKTIAEARHCWKLKRSLPLGKHVYEKKDLTLK